MPIGTPQIPNFNLKVVFLIHFIFMSLSLMGMWHTDSYLFYNCIFMLLLIWSIFHGQSQEPLQLAIVCNGTAILLDILVLIMCFPDSYRARERFSAAMSIFNLLIRPFTTYFLIKNLEERGGNPAFLFCIVLVWLLLSMIAFLNLILQACFLAIGQSLMKILIGQLPVPQTIRKVAFMPLEDIILRQLSRFERYNIHIYEKDR